MSEDKTQRTLDKTQRTFHSSALRSTEPALSLSLRPESPRMIHMASRAPTQRARVPLSLFHRARQRGVRTSRTSCGREVCVLSHTSMPATTRLAPNRGASRGGLLCPYHGASQRSTGLNEIRAKQQRHCCRLAELVTEHEDDHISNGAQTWRLRCGTRTSC